MTLNVLQRKYCSSKAESAHSLESRDGPEINIRANGQEMTVTPTSVAGRCRSSCCVRPVPASSLQTGSHQTSAIKALLFSRIIAVVPVEKGSGRIKDALPSVCSLGRPPQSRYTTGIVQPWSAAKSNHVGWPQDQDEAADSKSLYYMLGFLILPRSGFVQHAFRRSAYTPNHPALSPPLSRTYCHVSFI